MKLATRLSMICEVLAAMTAGSRSLVPPAASGVFAPLRLWPPDRRLARRTACAALRPALHSGLRFGHPATRALCRGVGHRAHVK
jgi:hypothetical protein